ncbi:hypothetical protein DI272_27275 [Streptomyces sp. Act143]|uniref:hypothetical protein n=1 Tax=Streptomyces sp. Act143 TaxID=2200760 RepID=UPI000D677A79|nr:hypothetical protein [Streptomyces sp. Act143]PWI17448.1 hypothetical protein DI272_27275 [Streptomyces sp. Act143]
MTSGGAGATPEHNWKTGEGVSGIDDPAEVDAAFERGEWPMGTAVIALALHCSLEEASPRIIRAMQLPDRDQRGFAYTAAGVAARLNGALTPELYAALRAEGHRGFAVNAVDDTLDYVPFRDLPLWFKWRKIASRVADKVETWRLNVTYATESAWEIICERRAG